MERKEISMNNNLILKIIISICVVLAIVIVGLIVLISKTNISNIGNKDNSENQTLNNNSEKIVVKGNTIEELKANSKADIENLTTRLENEWKILSGETKSFDSYKKNQEKISNYYDEIVKDSEEFSIRVREYALKYGEIIVNSDKSFDDKYDELEGIYDDIYDGVAEDLYNNIYNGLLEDMYDYYYDGILSDAYDNVSYDDYSDISSTEYKNYSNAQSDVYKAYYKCRSDVYQFYSKLQRKIFSKDLDKAKEIIQDFSKDIEKLKTK